MTIYVDPLQDWGKWSKSGGSCHMASDTSEAELKTFGRALGLPDSWYQAHPIHPHYDLSASWRKKAVSAGAVEVAAGGEFARLCSRMFNKHIG